MKRPQRVMVALFTREQQAQRTAGAIVDDYGYFPAVVDLDQVSHFHCDSDRPNEEVSVYMKNGYTATIKDNIEKFQYHFINLNKN